MPIVVNTERDQILNHLLPNGKLPRGDLYVRFDIEFPTNIKVDSKNQVVELLK